MMRAHVLLLSVVAGCATAPAHRRVPPTEPSGGLAVAVRFQNDLEACVRFDQEGTDVLRNLVVLKAQMRMVQSIGECGCKSAALVYRVHRDDRTASNMDTVGRMNTLVRQPPSDEPVVLVLATDAAMLHQAKSATIHVTCTDPD